MKMMRIRRYLIQPQISPIRRLPFSTQTLLRPSPTDIEKPSPFCNRTLLKPFPTSSSWSFFNFSPVNQPSTRSATWVRSPPLRFLSTSSPDREGNNRGGGGEEESDGPFSYETSSEEESDGWQEEPEVEPKLGDGGSGGGIAFQGVPWGERALAIAREVLEQFGVDDIELFAFKTTPRGYIYLRLDKLSSEYGCPDFEVLEDYCKQYNKRLEEVGALGEIPDNLAVEVSSPGADRLLKVPNDLDRFKDMAMNVSYMEEGKESNRQAEKLGVFYLESIDTETENCVWKLADVKENRDPLSKGRPFTRKQRDWRLTLPFRLHTKVALYVEF